MPQELAAQKSYSAVRPTLALVIVWSAREPHRVGEVALLSAEEGIWIIGRNPHCQSPGMQLRMRGRPVSFFRQRPLGAVDRSQPLEGGAMLAGEGISRRQIEIEVQQDALRIRNIGRCPLRVNGVAVSEALVRPRDTIYLPNQIMFYCCWRPLEMAPLRAYPTERAPCFGEPDQDGIIGESPAVWELRERLALSAGTYRPVIIKGDCRIAREQAERALSAMVSQSLFAPAAANRQRKEASAPNPGKAAPAFGHPPGLPAEQAVRMGVATTEPGFQEVEVPGLNERAEDIPFILYQILREQAHDEDEDLSPYFWMGLPRIHPSMIETLLHQFYSRHISQLAELAQQAMSRRSRRDLARRSVASKERRKPSPDAEQAGPRRDRVINPLRQSTLAMLLREGLAIPNEWTPPVDTKHHHSRDS